MFAKRVRRVINWNKIESQDVAIFLHGIDEEQTTNLNLCYPEFSPIKNTKIRAEKAATKALFQNILPGQKLAYDEFGKPFIADSSQHISISHSYPYIVISSAAFNHGTDIQVASSKILRLIPKFCSQLELEFINASKAADKSHLIWSAKEAIYKWHGRKKVIFKEQIRISPFHIAPSGTIQAEFIEDNRTTKIQLGYEITPEYYLVHTCKLNN